MGHTFFVRSVPATGDDGVGWEGPATFRSKHKAISRLLAVGAATEKERDILVSDGKPQEYDAHDVKQALVNAYLRLAPGLYQEALEDRDHMWKLPALQRDIGGALTVCEYAIMNGERIVVFWW